MIRESLKIYETIVTTFLNEGKVGFSSQIWINVIELNYLIGNFERALELLEKSIEIAPPQFAKEAENLANRIRKK